MAGFDDNWLKGVGWIFLFASIGFVGALIGMVWFVVWLFNHLQWVS